MADKINDGGPAFPPMHDPQTHVSGMSLRDWFAGMALQGMLAEPGSSERDNYYHNNTRAAYRMADAMLKARKVKFDG